MSAKTFGFGIIGTGMIADFHARAIADLPNAKLVAGCDINRERVDAFAAKHACRAYTDFQQMLADRDVDVVTISTPSGLHIEPAVAAAEHGKHVVCEKPLEVTLERIDRMIAAHAKAGTVLAGVFQSRFSPVNQLIKQTVDAGRFGRLTFGSAYCPWWRTQEYYGKGGWKGTRAMDGGGALMNQSIHAIDLLQWVMGPVKSICGLTAKLAHPQIEVEDTAGAVLEFANGALGLIQGATSMWPGQSKRLEICGDAGTAISVEDSLSFWSFANETPADEAIRRTHMTAASSGGAADPAAISHVGHTRCFASALEAIQTGKPPAVDGAAARKAVEIILAVYESARTGKRIDLK
ncbi:MAG: Gfo/Idh/MocA family oxidoreductase [Phycisphaerae bacterium]|nr:Gfo/Idh/MocA family oxidoreductase [Phycisphaerae bacterium]